MELNRQEKHCAASWNNFPTLNDLDKLLGNTRFRNIIKHARYKNSSDLRNRNCLHTLQSNLKLCTHDQDLRICKFCIYANFAYVSKSIFYFAFTWLLRINRICRKLKFYSIKVINSYFLELRTCLNILILILQVSKFILDGSTYVTMHMI